MKNRNYTIDAIKAVCAFLVVVLHSPDFIGKDFTLPLTNLAVPMFFIISGYFICNYSFDKYKLRIKNILIIFLLSELLFLLWFLVLNSIGENINFSEYFTLGKLIKFAILNDQITNQHLWYIQAYMYVLVIFSILKYFNLDIAKLQRIILPVLCVYIVVLSDILPYYMDVELCLYRNWILGFVCVSFGMIIKRNEDRILKTINSFLYLFIISFILNYIIGIFYHVSYIFILLVTVSAMCCAISANKISENNIIAKIGCKYSLYIYIIHPILSHIINFIFIKLSVNNFTNYFVYIITFAASIVVSVIYIKTKDFCKFIKH